MPPACRCCRRCARRCVGRIGAEVGPPHSGHERVRRRPGDRRERDRLRVLDRRLLQVRRAEVTGAREHRAYWPYWCNHCKPGPGYKLGPPATGRHALIRRESVVNSHPGPGFRWPRTVRLAKAKRAGAAGEDAGSGATAEPGLWPLLRRHKRATAIVVAIAALAIALSVVPALVGSAAARSPTRPAARGGRGRAQPRRPPTSSYTSTRTAPFQARAGPARPCRPPSTTVVSGLRTWARPTTCRCSPPSAGTSELVSRLAFGTAALAKCPRPRRACQPARGRLKPGSR